MGAEDYSAQYIDTVISMNAHSIIRSLVLRKSEKATLLWWPAKFRKFRHHFQRAPKVFLSIVDEKRKKKNRSVNFSPINAVSYSSPKNIQQKKLHHDGNNKNKKKQGLILHLKTSAIHINFLE